MEKAALSVVEKIKKYADIQPNSIALVVNDEEITYRQLFQRISSAASILSSYGVKKGSHVLSMATPNAEYIISMYAILGLGAVHIPAENNCPAMRLEEIAKTTDAEFILSPQDPECGTSWISQSYNDDIVQNDAWNPVGISKECSEIIFTTGTTGKSKGVMLSSHCLDTYICAMSPSFQLDENSVFLVSTPLNHVGGLHRIHQCMAAGSTVVLMDGIKILKNFFSAINTYGVTHTYLPPASVKILISLAKKDLAKLNGKLKFIYTASAPFPPADIEKLMSLLPDTHLHQGYGSSETGSICNCWYNAPGETINSLGIPYPCVTVKLLDDEGKEIKIPNEEGRICSKSEMNMLGYYNEPELTEKVLRDGYIYSSDLMFFDEHGGLHFAGRSDDVINVNGFKVAPTEVENIALKYDGVIDCICIPYNDRVQGKTLKLLIKAANNVDPHGLVEFLSSQLEPYKVPKSVEFVDEVSRTPNGKLNRKQMIENWSA